MNRDAVLQQQIPIGGREGRKQAVLYVRGQGFPLLLVRKGSLEASGASLKRTGMLNKSDLFIGAHMKPSCPAPTGHSR